MRDSRCWSAGELPEKVLIAFVAPRFLEVWGVAPMLGRDFAPDEEKTGVLRAVLISDRLWRRRFGASPSAVGRHLRIGQASPMVVGVMPPTFRLLMRDVFRRRAPALIGDLRADVVE